MALQESASDIKIDKLVLRAANGLFDLTNLLEELNIYEDIFANSMKAHLTLQDSLNVPFYAPIVGEEYVDISFRQSSVTASGEKGTGGVINPPRLYVHELSDRVIRTPKSQRYSLDLVSEQYMNNVHTKISRSYSDGNWSISDIVEDVWANNLDDERELYVEETLGAEKIVVPNWSPHDLFNWLARRARAEEKPTAVNYLYFESMEGSHFVSLDTLMGNEPVLTFALKPRLDDPRNIEHLAVGQVKVDAIIIDKGFQKIRNINNGLYASKLITHDIVKKKIEQHDYNGFNEYFQTNHVAKFPSVSNSPTSLQSGSTFNTSFGPAPAGDNKINEGNRLSEFVDSCIEFYPKHENLYAEDFYDNKAEEWLLRRKNQMQQMDGQTMVIECTGLSFIRLGLIVHLFIPSPETTSHGKQDVSVDKFLSGRYMITAIQHIIVQDSPGRFDYKMRIELSKDGYSDVVPFSDLREDERTR